MGIRALVCALTVLVTPLPAVAQEVSVTFYDTLSPHGDWVVVESYGRVWRPHRAVVGVDFVPYASGGRWVHSNVGWVFEPSWSWGWLPFHYGRWYLDPFNGWVWVPDNIWAPAWVEWRIGGGYIGWAPSPPRYHSQVRASWYFVENRRFVEPEIWHHRARAVNVETVLQVTRPIPPSGRAWAVGPPVAEIRAVTSVPIPERQIAGPPPRPVQIFPAEMPPPAPAPPSGTNRAQPPPPAEREPTRAPQPMQPVRPEPVRVPPPMPQEPIQRELMRAPPPMQPQPLRPEPMRAPPPMQQQPLRPEPMRAPPPMQQQPAQQPMPAPQQEQPGSPNSKRRAQPGPPFMPAPIPGNQPGPPPGRPR